jgi:hypothetical protein
VTLNAVGRRFGACRMGASGACCIASVRTKGFKVALNPEACSDAVRRRKWIHSAATMSRSAERSAWR